MFVLLVCFWCVAAGGLSDLNVIVGSVFCLLVFVTKWFVLFVLFCCCLFCL